MKLSIITINYNNADGLKKTIESVINQTSHDFEYIVIDGGSTDGSVEVIKQYSGKLAYWVSEKDAGLYNAMNKGILKAKGEYCQFLNSGDWLTDNKVVAKMLEAMPDCSIFYGNLVKVFENGKTYRDTAKEGNVSMLNLYRGTINHSSALIKRRLFAIYGMYDEQLKIVADWKFFFIAVGLHDEPVKYINMDVTCFDMKGISNTQGALDKKERREVLEAYLPTSILADYDSHWADIEQMKRLNRYPFSRFVAWLMERGLFKWEKRK